MFCPPALKNSPLAAFARAQGHAYSYMYTHICIRDIYVYMHIRICVKVQHSPKETTQKKIGLSHFHGHHLNPRPVRSDPMSILNTAKYGGPARRVRGGVISSPGHSLNGVQKRKQWGGGAKANTISQFGYTAQPSLWHFSVALSQCP